MKIDKDKIVAEALNLLNDVGLERLTTRALALRLGVQQPALYWHFKDRRALLDAMNDAMMARLILAPPLPGMTWQDHLFETGKGMHGALMAYRDGAQIHAGTRANRGLLEQQMTSLVAAGLPIPLAVQLLVSIGRFVVGWALEEQAEPMAMPGTVPQPGSLASQSILALQDMGDDVAFEAGLRMLINGAAVALSIAENGDS